jgi:hypothetical protein
MPLSEILAVDAVTKVTGAEAQQHWFQIRTANVDFFVGDDSQVNSDTRYIDSAIGQYYALSHTIAGRTRMKASDGRPAAPGNPKLLVKITGKEKV